MLDAHTATTRLAREMHQTEMSIAHTLVSATALFNTAAIANRDHGSRASASKAQAALLRLSKMAAGIIDVQASAMRAHADLLSIGVETGMLDTPGCPDREMGSARLTAVA